MSHALTVLNANTLLRVIVAFGSFAGAVALLPTLRGVLDAWLQPGWQLWLGSTLVAYALAAWAFPELAAFLYSKTGKR